MAKHVTLIPTKNKDREEEEKRQSMIDRLIGNSRKTETKKTTETRTHSTAQATQTQPARQHSEIYMKQREHQPIVVARKDNTFYSVKPRYTVEQDAYEKTMKKRQDEVKRQNGIQQWNSLQDYMKQLREMNNRQKERVDKTYKILGGQSRALNRPDKSKGVFDAMKKTQQEIDERKASEEQKKKNGVTDVNGMVNQSDVKNNIQPLPNAKPGTGKFYQPLTEKTQKDANTRFNTDLLPVEEEEQKPQTGTSFLQKPTNNRAFAPKWGTENAAEEEQQAAVTASAGVSDSGSKGMPNYGTNAADLISQQRDTNMMRQAEAAAQAAAENGSSGNAAQPQGTAVAQGKGPRVNNNRLMENYFLSRYNRAVRASKTYEGYDGYEDWLQDNGITEKGTIQLITPEIYMDYLEDVDDRGGLYDTTTEVTRMSDEGVRAAAGAWAAKAEELRAEAQARQDYMENPIDREGMDEILYFAGDVLGVFGEDDRDSDEYEAMLNEAAERLQMSYGDIGGIFSANNEEEQEDRRRILYETIMQGERYDEIVSYLEDDPEDLEALNGMLDRMLDDMREHNNYTNADYAEEHGRLLRQADALDDYARQAEDEIARRQDMLKYDEMAAELGTQSKGDYDPERVKDPVYLEYNGQYIFEPRTSDEDKLYWFANNPVTGYSAKLDPANMAWDSMTEDEKHLYRASFMKQKERKLFNQFSDADRLNGTQMAKEYFDQLEPLLTSRMREYQEFLARDRANTNGLGVLDRVTTYGVKVGAGAAGTYGAIRALLGDEDAAKEGNRYTERMEWVNTVRDEQNQNFAEWVGTWAGQYGEDAARLIADCADSMVDNLVAMGVGKAFAGGSAAMATSDSARKVAQGMIQFIMSSEATAGTFLEKLGSMSGQEAAIYAIGDGLIEALTEKYSLEQILDPDMMKQDALTYIMRSATAEMSEEIASEVLGTGMDSVLAYFYGHATELKKKYNQLIASGKYTDEQAAQKVLGDKLGEIAKAGLSGFLSGGAMAGGHLMSTNRAMARQGGTILETNEEAQGNGALNSLLESGRGLGSESQSASMASQIQADMKNGKKPGKLKIGRLGYSVQAESAEKAQDAAKEAVQKSVTDALKEEGLQGNELAEMADVVTKAATEGEDALTRSERKALQANRAGSHVLNLLKNDTDLQRKTRQAVRENTEPYVKAAETARNASEGRTAEGVSVEDVNSQMATEDEMNNAEGERTTGKDAAVIGGRWGRITGVVAEKEGKRVIPKYRVEVDGRTETVDASDLSPTDFGTAAIIRKAATNKGTYSARFTNLLFDEAKKNNVNVGTLLRDAEKIRMSAYLGMARPETELSEETAERIWLDSTQEMTEDRQAEVDEGRNYEPGKEGSVKFNGAEYGSGSWSEMTKGFSKRLRNQMDTLARIAQKSGINLEFKTAEQIGGEDAKGVFGSENKNGIMLNIEGADVEDENGNTVQGHHLLVGFGHEATHWLQRNSMRAYNQLRQYVLDTMANDGVDLQARVQKIMDSYAARGDDLDLNGAIAEIVANASDQILANESVQERLAEENPTLFGKVKQFVADLVDRIRSAVKGMQASASRDSLAMMKYGNELAKMWLGAYDEVLSSRIEQGEAQAKAETQVPAAASLREVDEAVARHSFRDDDDVRAWMNSLTPGALRNDAERQLLQDYKSKRINIDLAQKRIREYEDQVQKLEQKTQLTGEERDTLTALRNKIGIQEEKKARWEADLDEITGSEGYASMMYYWNKVLNDTVFGKTQAQVDAAVTEMQKTAEEVAKEIGKRQKELQTLKDDSSVKVIRRELGKKGLNKYVKALKDFHKTAMTEEEMTGRMAEIVLRTVQGEDAQPDIEALAEDLVMRSDGDLRNEALNRLGRLRGMTVRISAGEMAEAKARGWDLKEIRNLTRGSGIRFVESTDTKSTLKNDVQEIIEENPELNDGRLENEDALVNFVGYVADMLEQARRAGNEFGGDPAEAAGNIRATLNLMLSQDAGGMSAEELNTKIRREAGRVADMQDDLNRLKERTDALLDAGMKAKRWTDVLQNDMSSAVEYYDKTAKQAAEVARQQVREGVIKQLRTENAKKLVAQQEKYEEMIRKDRKARETAEDNLKLRKQINTNISRLKNRLIAETDTKNIPEEAKPMARMMVKMLAEHDAAGYRHVLFADKKQLADLMYRLHKMDKAFGKFDADEDLKWLVVTAPNEEDNDTTVKEKVWQDLAKIEMGLVEYRNAEGQGYISLNDRKAALTKIEEAVAEIYDIIKARSDVMIKRKRYEVKLLAEKAEKEMEGSRFKGEKTTKLGKAIDTAWNAVGYGNLTPEYFFKNLKNSVMNLLHSDFLDAENRSGLEAFKAQKAIEEIAQETGYTGWDGQEKHQVKLVNGRTIELTTEQLMTLYATWKREQNMQRPEDTSHLLNGGFVLPADSAKGKGLLGTMKMDTKPIRVKAYDLDHFGDYLTEQQRDFADRIVDYMSNDLAKLGNEASMRMFGIKKFTEQYYFPIKSWGGVLNQRSDAGVTNNSENRAARASFTNRLRANAQNAIEIADFTATAMKHIVGMINYNTVAPAVENMNRVLNYQLKFGDYNVDEMTGEEEDETYKINVRAAFRNAYGKKASDYLQQFLQDINGGVARRNEVMAREKLLSVFRKSAVAGSLSVAAQQPLSYIRASMMISPKYLAAAVDPRYWKGSFTEMMDHSGVAVIKQMGKFDMNYGRSMIDYITPDTLTPKWKQVTQKTSDAVNALPGLMDNMTWTRMWTAVKLEQKAAHPEMDVKSDEFLDMVAERFNEVMRKTQVYDSVLVKSRNMRSNNWAMKMMTSFMAEPTLSLNVLADAWMNIREKGGKANAAKALATFVLSGVAQASVKGFFGAGRTPDDKKTKEENFYFRFVQNLLSELNPLGLIPGYSDLIDALKNGELTDDSYTVIGKAFSSVQKLMDLLQGKESKRGTYRDIEDSWGQLVQYASSIPMKNIMRDIRAMATWFSGGTAEWTGGGYAQRATNAGVMKYQALESLMTTDLIGLVNQQMGEAGYKTNMDAYYNRLYQLQREGNTQAAKELKDYLVLAKMKGSDPETQLEEKLRSITRNDDDLSAAEKYEAQKEYGLKKGGKFILDEYKAGNLTREEAEELYRKENPNMSDKDVAEALGKADWTIAGNDSEKYTNYTPVYAAMDSGDKAAFSAETKKLLGYGYKQKDINDKVKSYITDQFKNGELTRSQAEKKLKEYRSDMSDDEIWWTMDRQEYAKEKGVDTPTGTYYRLKDAIASNRSENIRTAIGELLEHGVEKKNIKTQLSKEYKQDYLAADEKGKVRIRNAMQLAYKELGLTAEDADKTIKGWKAK